jgi:hypothetical protein
VGQITGGKGTGAKAAIRLTLAITTIGLLLGASPAARAALGEYPPGPPFVGGGGGVSAGPGGIGGGGGVTVGLPGGGTVTGGGGFAITPVNGGGLAAGLGAELLINGLPLGTVIHVHAGDLIFLSGKGFKAFSAIHFWFESVPIDIGSTTADANGEFGINVRIPIGVTPGSHHIVAEGIDPLGSPLRVVFPVIVDPSNLAAGKNSSSGLTGLEAAALAAAAVLLFGLGVLLVLRLRKPTEIVDV